MALSDYEIPRTSIRLNEKASVDVRALSLDDVSFLVRIHQEDIEALVSMFQAKVGAKKGNVDPSKVSALVEQAGDKMISSFLQQFPLLAANIIAVASDEPGAWATARKLPVPVQIDALLAVARLTFEDAEGFKKFVGNVTAAMQSASAQAPQVASKTSRKTKSTGSTD